MKKLISLLLVSLILCLSIGTVSASPYDDREWVLGENAEYLTNNGYTYYPVYPSDHSYRNLHLMSKPLKFTDEQTKQQYEDSYVYASEVSANYCVWVDLQYFTDSYYRIDEVLYVREDYLETYEKLASGEAEHYVVMNDYKSLYFRFTKEQMNEWRQGEELTIPANSIYKYFSIPLMASDRDRNVEVECDTILWDMSTDEFYLLKNSDYDSNKVYTVNDTLIVYKLEDEDVRERLALYISYVPEDDLEWMNPGFSEESDNTALFVLAGVFFGVIPFAVLALSVVMFFVTKTKSYRRGFVLMGIGSILILLAFVLMILFLL